MTSLTLLRCISAVFAAAAILAASAPASSSDESFGGLLSGPPVLGAPFSADATTTVHAILGDGTRLDQTTTDRYYRDSGGRVRVERLTGLPAPATASERRARTIVDPEPGDAMVYTMDAETRSFVLSPRSIMGLTIPGGRSLYVYIGGVKFVGFRRAGDLWSADPSAYGDVRWEPLGTRRIAGIEAAGRRITMTVPPRYRGHGEPTRMSDERWESAELGLLVQSRHADSRSVIEYRLSNLLRDEPAAHLFEIPPDYTAGYPITAHDKRMSFVAAESFRADRNR